MSEINEHEQFWGKIDAILVLNLDAAEARLARFMQVWQGVLPADKLHRVGAVRGTELPGYGKAPWFRARTGERRGMWAGMAGCALSHAKAIRCARHFGYRRVLILEDDAMPVTTDKEAWQIVADALAGLPERSMLYLGYHRPNPYGYQLREVNGHGLWRTEGVLTTHAYIISEGLYETALAYLPQEETVWDWVARYRAVDTMYCRHLSARRDVCTLVIYPALVHQDEGESAIGGDRTGGIGLLCTQPPRTYRSFAGVAHMLFAPFRRLSARFHSLYHRGRARWLGFPGRRSRRRKATPDGL